MVAKLPGIRAPNPLSYTGPKFNLMPVFGFSREPTVDDNKYLISSFVVILDNPSTGTKGDLWYLSQVDSTGDAIWLKIETGRVTDGIDTVTTDDGLPVVDPDGSGNINILGGVGIAVTGNGPGSTITVTATGVISETITGDTGGPLSPTAGNWDIFGRTTPPGTIPVTTSGSVSTLNVDVQISTDLVAPDITKVGLSNFDSVYFTVDTDGFVTASGSGFGETITGDTGGALSPFNGNWNVFGNTVVAGTVPITTIGATSIPGETTLTVTAQLSQALAAADITKVGFSNFDSVFFAVDADGFVTTSGTGLGETITGDSGGPLSPTAGNWNILATTVAAGINPITTLGSGSTLTINAQLSQALPISDIDQVGLSNFDSDHFSVDANGFVTLSNPGSLVWIDEGAGITLSVDTGYFITAAVTETLPASPVQGDTVKIICDNAAPIVITANTGQAITIGMSSTSIAGTATSTDLGDTLELFFRAATNEWKTLSVIGSWSLA